MDDNNLYGNIPGPTVSNIKLRESLFIKLFKALINNNNEQIKLVIEELQKHNFGVNTGFTHSGVTHQGSPPTTPLHLAIQKDNLYAIDLLLKAGAYPFVQSNKAQRTPIAEACKVNSPNVIEIIKLLLQYGAKSNHIKPFIYAIRHNNLPVVKLLIEAGFDVNNNTRETLLCAIVHFSSQTSIPNEDILTYLLESGADPNVPPNGGIGDEDYPPFLMAILKNNFALVKKLFAAGGNVNQPHFDHSPLQYAASNSSPEIVEFLCSKGANVNYRVPNKNFTALIFAVIRKPISFEILEILCYYGADKTIQTYQGLTAMDYAQTLDDHLIDQVMNILLYCGVTTPGILTSSMQPGTPGVDPAPHVFVNEDPRGGRRRKRRATRRKLSNRSRKY